MQWHTDGDAKYEKQKYSIMAMVDKNLLGFTGGPDTICCADDTDCGRGRHHTQIWGYVLITAVRSGGM